ncbi:hypothetical protein AKJ16_DCAP10474, partial [Drosera capensis]
MSRSWYTEVQIYSEQKYSFPYLSITSSSKGPLLLQRFKMVDDVKQNNLHVPAFPPSHTDT